MNYQEMSDFEINKEVAKALGGFSFNDEGVPYKLIPNSCPAYTGIDFDEVEFDPCNSWSDAGIIIAANRINLLWNMSNWSSWSSEFSELETNHENPLRAAMVVFLMMKGGE